MFLRCLETNLETSLSVPLMMIMVTRQLASQLERAPDHQNRVISQQKVCVALFSPSFCFFSLTSQLSLNGRLSFATVDDTALKTHKIQLEILSE